MVSYVYVVHSNIDEDNIYNEFETLTEAVDYAKEYIDKQTYVEQVEVEINDFGEVIDSGEPELAWSYEGDEAADYEVDDEVDDDITAEEEAELDADYQAMAEAEHPIDEAVSTKKDYHARLDELEAKLEAMDEDVCKDYKVITHSEDEVKDLKESLDDYEIKNERGHYVVYKGTEFVLAADTEAEAEKELDKLLATNEEIDYNKLREELEENEDEVECQVCFETFAKEDCIKGEHGYVCKHCAELQEAKESQVEEVKPEVGMTIRITAMPGDPIEKEYIGREGVIEYIDDAGQLHGTWGGLALLPKIDKYEIISTEKESLIEDTKISPLDFFKKVVDRHKYDTRFLNLVKEDVYAIDEFAPGLYSISALSEDELKELHDFVVSKIK